jgi:hypothetical protein
MSDPILERIWRASDTLLKKHGGLDGYFKYVQKLHEAHERKRKQKTSVSAKKKRPLAKHSRV